MKTPEEYLQKMSNQRFSLIYDTWIQEEFEIIIKQVQIDTYNQALDDAVENAEIIEQWSNGYGGCTPSLNKNSILKLKK